MPTVVGIYYKEGRKVKKSWMQHTLDLWPTEYKLIEHALNDRETLLLTAIDLEIYKEGGSEHAWDTPERRLELIKQELHDVQMLRRKIAATSRR